MRYPGAGAVRAGAPGERFDRPDDQDTAVRLLIDDALATAPYGVPLKAGWIDAPPGGVIAEARPGLTADVIGQEDIALVPVGELPVLQATHRVAPDAAIVFGETGTVALRCPVRPDEIERTPVRLWETSSFGLTLARAAIQPFYGIQPVAWSAHDDPAAQVVVVEGAEALRPPEAGFAEDLCRAWFILTGRPAVGYVLVVPRSAERGDVAPALETLTALREVGDDRRRDLRRILAEQAAGPMDRLQALFALMGLALEPSDRPSLLMLLQRGHGGGAAPYVRTLDFLESEA